MGNNEMAFERGDVKLELYRDDNGMWRVYRSVGGDGYTVGTALDRALASGMFLDMVIRETSAWGREA